MNKELTILPSSFRDPSGQLFWYEGILYRQINSTYREQYEQLMDSGLYRELVDAELLIPHQEVSDVPCPEPAGAYKTIKPRFIPFISYPYEWSFSQLQDAALLTLAVQKKALDLKMTLKDASAYNIQFAGGKPVFIDTLSFEHYREGTPWVAYRQFCQHFLAPLALMSYRGHRLHQMLRVFLDGIPLDLASSLLPFATRLRFSLLSHIHLHARSQKHYAAKKTTAEVKKRSHFPMLGLIDNLESAVTSLKLRTATAEWTDYYEEKVFSAEYLEEKKALVSTFLERINPSLVWDLGANTGLFSRIASNKGILTLSLEIDPDCVEKNYKQVTRDKESSLLPLLLDLTNPSPSLGWENNERDAFVERGPADMVMALALLHHLAISNNLPFSKIAAFFRRICTSLIIEFIPKSDPRAKQLLLNREDVFENYTREHFETEFAPYFHTLEKRKLENSERMLYLMAKKETYPGDTGNREFDDSC